MSEITSPTQAQVARIHGYQADSALASLRKGVETAATNLRRAAEDIERGLARYDEQVAGGATPASWNGTSAEVRLAADTIHTAAWVHANLGLDSLSRDAAEASLHAALRDALGGAADLA